MNGQKNPKNKWMYRAIVVLGIVCFAYGLLTFLITKSDSSTSNTFFGMFTGFGAGILAVAITGSIRQKVASPEVLEKEEIDRNDERNIAIARAACAIGMWVAVAVLVVLAFVFMGIGLRLASYLCLAGVLVTYLGAWIAQKVLEKKM